MGFLALTADERVVSVKFTKDAFSVSLREGRTITVPLAWHPRLLDANSAQRKNSPGGMASAGPTSTKTWSTEGLLRGAPAIA